MQRIIVTALRPSSVVPTIAVYTNRICVMGSITVRTAVMKPTVIQVGGARSGEGIYVYRLREVLYIYWEKFLNRKVRG